MMALPEKPKAVCCAHEGEGREQELALPQNVKLFCVLWACVGTSCRRCPAEDDRDGIWHQCGSIAIILSGV